MWVGGKTALSLRRAVRYGDGWVPVGLRRDELRTMLEAVELPPGFEVVLSTGRALDPAGEPDRAEDALRALRDTGATVVGATLRSSSADHYCEQLEALAAVAGKVE